MQRKRDELVPIGEVVSGLGDVPVPAIRDDLPGPDPAVLRRDSPAQHRFTLSDQVNALVGASEADPDRGFMARLLSLCSLPRTNPGNQKEYIRRNGPYMLGMTAGLNNKLPFGNLPRLLLAWVCTEAVRTGSRELVLGKSLSEFMRTLGVYSSDGKAYTRLRNQMDRLFNAHVSLIYEDKRGKATVNSLIGRRTEFCWNPKRPDESTLWESKIELSEDFFNEIIQHPVPLDMNTLTALKRSSLGLDLYLWLTYRTFPLRAPLRLTWRQVYRCLGWKEQKTGLRGSSPNGMSRKTPLSSCLAYNPPEIEIDGGIVCLLASLVTSSDGTTAVSLERRRRINWRVTFISMMLTGTSLRFTAETTTGSASPSSCAQRDFWGSSWSTSRRLPRGSFLFSPGNLGSNARDASCTTAPANNGGNTQRRSAGTAGSVSFLIHQHSSD